MGIKPTTSQFYSHTVCPTTGLEIKYAFKQIKYVINFIGKLCHFVHNFLSNKTHYIVMSTYTLSPDRTNTINYKERLLNNLRKKIILL